MVPCNPARVERDLDTGLPPHCTIPLWGSWTCICHFDAHGASPLKTQRLHLLVSPGHPELPSWPALSLENGMYALHSSLGSLTRVPATLPSKECCLLILSDSGNLHSRAACQNTGQINMSFDYPLMAAKESINVIHK